MGADGRLVAVPCGGACTRDQHTMIKTSASPPRLAAPKTESDDVEARIRQATAPPTTRKARSKAAAGSW
jgi:hypothetical protein